MNNYASLFSPRSIAIIGASADESSISGQPIRFLREHGYAGSVYPVNPKYDTVGGHRCYPDVASLPEPPDVALIVVAARRVPDALRQLGAKRVPYAIVLSSGFAEIGDEGKAAQEEIAAIARERRRRSTKSTNRSRNVNMVALHTGMLITEPMMRESA